MEGLLTSTFPIRIETRPGRGRCVIAARDIVPGEVLLASQPIAFIPEDGQRCNYCMTKTVRKAENAGPVMSRCSTCKAGYCGKECQALDWPDHKKECKKLDYLKQHPKPVSDLLLLLSRTYRGSRASKTAGAGSITRIAIGQSQVPCYIHCLADVRGMQLADDSKVTPGASAAYANVGVLGRETGLLPLEDSLADKGAGAGLDGGTLTPDCITRDLLAFHLNNFTAVDESQQSGVGTGVFPAGALVNHACDANAGVTYAFAAGLAGLPLGVGTSGSPDEVGPDGRPSVAPPRAFAPVQIIRALREIREGEEVCHSYVDPTKPAIARRVMLETQYGFQCGCTACKTEEFAATDSAASDAVFGATPSPTTESDDTREANLARAQFMVSESELISTEPRSELSITIKARMREEGTPVADALDTAHGDRAEAMSVMAIQVAVLTHALKLFRRYLPPFHPDVIAVVHNILGASSLIDDLETGEAASRHLVAHSMRSPALAATPCHPMVVLQQYVALDRYLEWAEMLESAVPKGANSEQAGRVTAALASGLRGSQARRVQLALLFAGADTPGVAAFAVRTQGEPAESFTPSALRAHAALHLADLARKLRIAYGDCRVSRQMAARAAAESGRKPVTLSCLNLT